MCILCGISTDVMDSNMTDDSDPTLELQSIVIICAGEILTQISNKHLKLIITPT